jgi:hypothetical protein
MAEGSRQSAEGGMQKAARGSVVPDAFSICHFPFPFSISDFSFFVD